MSSKQFNKTITSITEPTNGLVGDSWFNPSTNKLFVYAPIDRLAPRWVEVLTSSTPNYYNLNNVNLSGKATFTGSTSSLALNSTNIVENISLMSTPIVGVYNYNVTAQTLIYVTASSTANFIINFTGSYSAKLNDLMAVGQSISCALMVTNGATAYYNSSLQVDGVAIAAKWQSGTAPSSGNTSAVDAYAYTIVKTANATFSVFASQTKFS